MRINEVTSPRCKSLDKKPQISLIHSYLRKKLHLPSNSFQKPSSNSGQISLTSKVKKDCKSFMIPKELTFNVSDENILKTPSSINENPPHNLELLNESLNNYYENEVTRTSLPKKSTTPNPISLEPLHKRSTQKRSETPLLRYKNPKNFPSIQNKSTSKKGETLKKPSKKIQKIRFFSRRERKSKSSEQKFVFYYFN
jgi:hypothetical protein